MFRIGTFSKLVQVSPRMLRHYEKCGLLTPAKIDKFQGYRYYSSGQIPFVKKIVMFRDMGFSIEEISDLIENFDDKDFVEKAVASKRTEIKDKLAIEEQRLLNLDVLCEKVESSEYCKPYPVVVKELPSQRILSLRQIIPDYSYQEQQWGKMFEFIAQNNLQTFLQGEIFCVYHCQEYVEKDPDLEVAVTVTKMGENKGDFVYRVTEPFSLTASAVFKGHYQHMAEWEGVLANWIEANNYEIVGSEHIIGHKHPLNEKNPDNYLTEVYFPIKKCD